MICNAIMSYGQLAHSFEFQTVIGLSLGLVIPSFPLLIRDYLQRLFHVCNNLINILLQLCAHLYRTLIEEEHCHALSVLCSVEEA